MLEVLHNICNMGSRDLPDMSALALRRCAPSGSCVHIRQITPAHVTYITYTCRQWLCDATKSGYGPGPGHRYQVLQ